MSSAYDLLTLIQQLAPGATLSELLAAQPGLVRRTVQRQLAQLIDDHAIVGIGAGRARRYYVTTQRITDYAVAREAEPLKVAQERTPYLASLPLDGADILAYITRPLQARHPVGYQREFLDDYQPNQTWYLPEPVRRQLHQIGQTDPAPAPAGTFGRAILNRLLIDLSWASSNLEGNTYTWLDTRELIQHGTVAGGKSVLEAQMILNHKAAIEFLLENIHEIGFNRFTLCNLHGILSDNLLPDRYDEGRVRQHAVGIGHSVYRPLFVPQVLNDLFDVMLHKADQILDPFEQSFFIMVHLPYLQPFADVNKRTARLAANLPLFRANLCPLTFLDLPSQSYTHAMLGVYEMTRIELLREVYVAAYQRSTREYLTLRQNVATPDPVRLAHRSLIRQTVRDVVLASGPDPFGQVLQAVARLPEPVRASVQAMIVDELSQLHPGVLSRYGLRPSELANWQQMQQAQQMAQVPQMQKAWRSA
jgi:Fic family protein